MSGSGGSGILIARKADGTWSPPSGILLHTAALGFVLGVDIYDCVLVINSVSTLEMFTTPRVTLGSDVGLTVGPLVAGPNTWGADGTWRDLDNTVLTYLKARGKFQGVALDGSLVTERGNENERFYRGNVTVLDILAGNVTKNIPEIRPLFEVIKAAEGRTDFDAPLLDVLSQQPAPGDAVIETPVASPQTPRSPFGIPDADDPDPFGVIALEMAGLEIREAGTKLRPTSSQFEFNPSPTSPVFGFNRQSIDTFMSRSNRGSYMSNKTHTTALTDAYTQTEETNTPRTALSPSPTEDGQDREYVDKVPVVNEPEEMEEIDFTQIDMSAVRHLSRRPSQDNIPELPSVAEEEDKPPVDQGVMTDPVEEPSIPYPEDERDEDADDEEEDDEEEEPIIYEVATAAQPTRTAILSSQVAQVIQAKGSLVNIPKRIPPPLPPRSPARNSRASKGEYGDVASLKSPLRNSFQSADLVPNEPTSVDAQVVEPPIVETPESYSDARDSASVYHSSHSDHMRRPSSIYTGMGNQIGQDSALRSPSTPQATERASSASGEEWDREPKTPRVEDVACFRAEGVDPEKMQMAREAAVEIETGSGEAPIVA